MMPCCSGRPATRRQSCSPVIQLESRDGLSAKFWAESPRVGWLKIQMTRPVVAGEDGLGTHHEVLRLRS